MSNGQLINRNEVRNEISPWFQGAYDKAKKGHSPMSAIKVGCGRCTGNSINEIENCKDEDCQFYEYRPYPKRKRHRSTNTSSKPRCSTGVFVQKRKKSGMSVSKTIEIKDLPEGPLRITVAIEPESKNKEK